MEFDYTVRDIQQVRFHLRDRQTKSWQPKFGYYKDNLDPVYDAMFELAPGSKYRLTADVKFNRLKTKSVLKKSFRTSDCEAV